VDPLRDYVDAGGFLFVGASSFTRNLNGTTRTEFALATEMGMSTLYPDLMNWAQSTQFNKIVDHRLVSGIPSGSLGWRMPLTAEQIPWGISPGHTGHWDHYIFTTEVTTATLIAQSSLRPLLTTRQYGQGNFIYYSPINPLIGYAPSMHPRTPILFSGTPSSGRLNRPAFPPSASARGGTSTMRPLPSAMTLKTIKTGSAP